MRPILPFMAALFLFGSLAGCSGSSSGSNAGSTGPSLNVKTCRAIENYPTFKTKSEALAYASFLKKEGAQASLDSALAKKINSLSTDLAGNENGTAADTTATVEGDATTLRTACDTFINS
jgi:hypothetical protein